MALASEGLGKDQLFSHHGKRYMHNCVSLYDQEFNHRRHHTTPRSWDWHRLAWLPEVSDHPVQGEGTKWGLQQTLKVRGGIDGQCGVVWLVSHASPSLPKEGSGELTYQELCQRQDLGVTNQIPTLHYVRL